MTSIDEREGKSARRPNQRARQKAETRRRLLEAATAVFLESGPATAPLDAVAVRAGVSRPTLFFHFGGRLELMDQLVQHLLVSEFQSEAEQHPEADLRSFMQTYLRTQQRPVVRLLWQLGDALQCERPDGPNMAYWITVEQVGKRLEDAGLDGEAARGRALVVAPALMLVARRAAFGLVTKREMKDFVTQACALVLP